MSDFQGTTVDTGRQLFPTDAAPGFASDCPSDCDFTGCGSRPETGYPGIVIGSEALGRQQEIRLLPGAPWLAVLEQHPGGAVGMQEGHLHGVRAVARSAVDEPQPSLFGVAERRLEVLDLEGEMVQPRPAPGQEL